MGPANGCLHIVGCVGCDDDLEGKALQGWVRYFPRGMPLDDRV
jgi:hypothetical protein